MEVEPELVSSSAIHRQGHQEREHRRLIGHGVELFAAETGQPAPVSLLDRVEEPGHAATVLARGTRRSEPKVTEVRGRQEEPAAADISRRGITS